MIRKTKLCVLAFSIGLIVSTINSLALAQSGTRSGSGTRIVTRPSADPNLAMRGYCAVCLRDMKKWIKGSPAHRVSLGGKNYLFPSDEQKQMFQADPLKYAPALNGDCAATYSATGQRVPGNLQYGLDHQGRFYFFATEFRKDEFKGSVDGYEGVDLALGGKCSVCLVEMNEAVDGKPEFTALHDGLRYQFPSEEQLGMFKSNAAKYALAKATAKPELAMSGYCSVCVSEMKKWVKGSPSHVVVFDGKRYLFPSAEQKEMFLNDPLKYVPVLGGDCAVCLKEMGKRVPGTVRHAAFHAGRLYLFPVEEQKKMFLEDADGYVNVDVAHGGNCAVCLVEMKETVPGNEDFAVIRNGVRYLFPGAEQRRQFLTNPAKYSVANTAKTD